MFRIDTPDATPNNRFTEGDPTIPIEATTVSADWLNSVQEELIAVLEHAGIEPNKQSTIQLRDAIDKLIEQRLSIATSMKVGLVQPDGETIQVTDEGVISIIPRLSEFKDFFEQRPPKGWAVRDGSILQDADTAYPALWTYLRKEENTWKCKSQADWTALSTAAGGIGGVPFFVLDEAAKTIKLPDTRTDHIYGNVGDSIGKWENDAMRNITAWFYNNIIDFSNCGGIFYASGHANIIQTFNPSGYANHQINLDASRAVPTAAQFRPRRIGLLPCVYVGGVH